MVDSLSPSCRNHARNTSLHSKVASSRDEAQETSTSCRQCSDSNESKRRHFFPAHSSLQIDQSNSPDASQTIVSLVYTASAQLNAVPAPFICIRPAIHSLIHPFIHALVSPAAGDSSCIQSSSSLNDQSPCVLCPTCWLPQRRLSEGLSQAASSAQARAERRDSTRRGCANQQQVSRVVALLS